MIFANCDSVSADFGVSAVTERSTERGSAERSPSKPHAEVLSKFSRTLLAADRTDSMVD